MASEAMGLAMGNRTFSSHGVLHMFSDILLRAQFAKMCEAHFRKRTLQRIGFQLLASS